MTNKEFLKSLDIENFPYPEEGVHGSCPDLDECEIKASIVGVRIFYEAVCNGPDESTFSMTEVSDAKKDVCDENWAICLMTDEILFGNDLDFPSSYQNPSVVRRDEEYRSFDYHIFKEYNKKPLSYYFKDLPEDYNRIEIRLSKRIREEELREVFGNREIKYIEDQDVPEGDLIISVFRG